MRDDKVGRQLVVAAAHGGTSTGTRALAGAHEGLEGTSMPRAQPWRQDMPHYFLHIQDGAELIEDPDGAEYADVAAAEREAAQDARHLMAECLRWGEPLQSSREIVICDARGIVLSSILFARAIPPDPPQ